MSPFSFGAAPDIHIDRKQTRKDLAAKHAANFILGYFPPGESKAGGMVGFLRQSGLKRQHLGWIWGMYVSPQQRSKGVGRALMNECLLRAKPLQGIERILLSVTDHSPAALALYLSLGFEEYAREPDALRWQGTSMTEIFLAMEL
ncbi:MAG: GNAT family N-acetyltransferase [Bacteroidota bacterium]